jgi:hypothetical protein
MFAGGYLVNIFKAAFLSIFEPSLTTGTDIEITRASRSQVDAGDILCAGLAVETNGASLSRAGQSRTVGKNDLEPAQRADVANAGGLLLDP